MNKSEKMRKARAGLLLVASPRFKNLSGPKRGTYGERKATAVQDIQASMSGFVDLVDPGIVYDREDAQRAMDLFYAEKVDFVYAEFLSWSEDFAWIKFLRDCPAMPILFCNVAKPRMTFETTLDEDDFVDYLCAGTLVGSLEGSGDVRRVPRADVTTVMGTRGRLRRSAKRPRVFSWSRCTSATYSAKLASSSTLLTTFTTRLASITWMTAPSCCGATFTAVCCLLVVAPPISSGMVNPLRFISLAT